MTEKEQHPTTQPEQTHSPHYHEEDETSLTDLLEILTRKKVLILVVTSICTLLSIVYAKSMTPIYQATIAFLEPQETFLSALPPEIAKDLPGWKPPLRDQFGKIIASPPRAFTMFLSKVTSFEFTKEVFKNGNFSRNFYGDNNVLDLDQSVIAIHDAISLTKEKAEENLPLFNRPIYLQMEGPKPEAMSEFLTTLAESAKQNITAEITSLIHLMTNTKIERITKEISSLRLTAKMKKERTIRDFSAALVVAKNLGLKNNSFDKLSNSKYNFGITNQIASGNQVQKTETSVDIRDTRLPIWFLYGEKALQQEIMKLKSKKNGGIVQGLVEKEVTLKKYQSIDLSMLKPKVYLLSQPSIPPTVPIKPKKIIIVAIGMALGLFVGIILAFIRNSMDQLREKQQSSTST